MSPKERRAGNRKGTWPTVWSELQASIQFPPKISQKSAADIILTDQLEIRWTRTDAQYWTGSLPFYLQQLFRGHSKPASGLEFVEGVWGGGTAPDYNFTDQQKNVKIHHMQKEWTVTRPFCFWSSHFVSEFPPLGSIRKAGTKNHHRTPVSLINIKLCGHILNGHRKNCREKSAILFWRSHLVPLVNLPK